MNPIPCPFCGGEVKIKVTSKREKSPMGWVMLTVPRARCTGCKKKFKNLSTEESALAILGRNRL